MEDTSIRVLRQTTPRTNVCTVDNGHTLDSFDNNPTGLRVPIMLDFAYIEATAVLFPPPLQPG